MQNTIVGHPHAIAVHGFAVHGFVLRIVRVARHRNQCNRFVTSGISKNEMDRKMQ